jgi:hypothetical protein
VKLGTFKSAGCSLNAFRTVHGKSFFYVCILTYSSGRFVFFPQNVVKVNVYLFHWRQEGNLDEWTYRSTHA